MSANFHIWILNRGQSLIHKRIINLLYTYIYGNNDDYDVNNDNNTGNEYNDDNNNSNRCNNNYNDDNNTGNDYNLSIYIIAYAIYSTSHYHYQLRYITPTREFLLDTFAYWYMQRIVYSCTIDAITLTK